MLANRGGTGIIGAMIDTPAPPVLTVRPYADTDYRMVMSWLLQRGMDFEDIALPPLGCVVEDETGPCAALFCAEPIGFGCAYLELPVSRPGLPLAQSMAAFKLAVESIIQVAGKCAEPPGEFHSFRAVTPAPLARVLLRMGFVRETEEPLIPMIYRKE